MIVTAGDLLGFGSSIVVGIITYASLKYSKQHDEKEEDEKGLGSAANRAAKTATMENDIKWIKTQFGPKPNGGGSMEQLLKHAARSDDNFEMIGEKFNALQVQFTEHLLRHK